MFHTNSSYNPDAESVSLGELPRIRAYSLSPGRSRRVSEQVTRKQSDDISPEQYVPNVEIKSTNPSSDDDSYYSWKRIREHRRGERDEDSGLSRRVKRFYKIQDELIDDYERVHNQGNEEAAAKFEEQQARVKKMANILTKVSLGVNIVRRARRRTRSIPSLRFTGVIRLENRQCCVVQIPVGHFIRDRLGRGSDDIRHSLLGLASDQEARQISLPTRYASESFFQFSMGLGRTRLEPVAIIILSVIMCAASVLVVYESINTIVNDAQYFTERNTTKTLSEIDMTAFPISVMVITAVSKSILFFLCYRVKTPTLSALAADHRNDVFSNLVALACGLVGKRAVDRRADLLFSRFVCLSLADQSSSYLRRSHRCRSHFLLYHHHLDWTGEQ